MKKCLIILMICCGCGTAYANSELSIAIANTRTLCGGIGNELGEIKKLAGINTAVTATGTVAGGGATVVGLVKSSTDKIAEEIEAELANLRKMAYAQNPLNLKPIHVNWAATSPQANKNNAISEKERQLAQLNEKSKSMGNWRTGLMATSVATNIAGAVIAGTNQVKGDLKSQIDACVESVKNLSNVRMQARISGTANEQDLAYAENIVRACEEWGTVDVSSINKKASGAAISSGVGAGLGLAGVVTSAMANTDKTRNDNSDTGKEKEKNLNTAANVLAGGTTIASATATIFNATQINATKRAVSVANKCEEALR